MQMHPDHERIRDAVRVAVLVAIDETTIAECGKKMCDSEVPNLFKTIDSIAERVWLNSVGL